MPRATRLQTAIPLREVNGTGGRPRQAQLPQLFQRSSAGNHHRLPVFARPTGNRLPSRGGLEKGNAPGPMPHTGVRGRGMPQKLDNPSRLRSA